MRLKYSFLLILGLSSQFIFAQISFTDQSSLLENQSLSSGFVMGVSDMNGDNLDDIIRFDDAIQAEIEFQQTDGTFSRVNIGNLTASAVWTLAVGDIDKNGINDFITGGFYDDHGLSILRSMGNGMYSTGTVNENLGLFTIFAQGSNLVDIDNDGQLDIFACHDDGMSMPFKGYGDGSFQQIGYLPTGQIDTSQLLINTKSTNLSFNAGNYSSCWIDYDNDSDLDLYISKCRLGTTDPDSGDRLNLMFRNDGDGNYTEVAPIIGLQPRDQSWATDFGDIDNDGDLDALIINHEGSTRLYENDGNGNFTDISLDAGINLPTSTFPVGMQVIMQDFDNDTRLDILLTSYLVKPILYHNQGNNFFAEVLNPWGTSVNTTNNNDIQSVAVGDLNNDGFYDMTVGFCNQINNPNATNPDKLFIAETNSNNWLKLVLKGADSNANGIGARITITGDFGVQIRNVRSGHAYGIQNSLIPHFGLGSSTSIDQLKVDWPSGKVSIIDNPTINQLHTICESSYSINYVEANICEGESMVLAGEIQTTSGIYSDTISTDSIIQTTLNVNPTYDIMAGTIDACFGNDLQFGTETISTPGTHVFNYSTAAGCDSIVTVDVNWFDEIIVNSQLTQDMNTQTGDIVIEIMGAADPVQINWSNGDTDVLSLINVPFAEYTVEIIDGNGCSYMETFYLGVSSSSELLINGINVYPNPFDAYFEIQNKNGLGTTALIYNALGQLVKKTNLNQHTNRIKTTELSSGHYLLKVMDSDNQSLGSMILQAK